MALTRPKYSQIYDTDWKQSVELATTGSDIGNLKLGNTQPNSIDSISTAIGMRVLVKDQTDASQNGIYTVRTLGAGSNGWWERSLDSNQNGFVTAGLTVTVAQGTINAGQEWRLVTPDPITLGTTPLAFRNQTGTPGGANTYVQFNDTTVLGGSPAFVFNKVSNLVSASGSINAAGNVSAVELVGRNLSTRSAYGNIHLTQFASIFAQGNNSENLSVIQLSTTGLSDGMGMLGSTGLPSSLFSTRGITFRTGATVRDQDTPTGGVSLVTITATGELFANAATTSTSTSTGALVVAGGMGIGGNLYIGANTYVTGSIIPTANIAYDLGTPTQKFRSAYFSGNTVYIGGESISVASDGTWSFTSSGSAVSLGVSAVFNPPSASIGELSTNAAVISGNLNVSGNIIGGNVTFNAINASTLNVAGGGLNAVAIGQSTPAAGDFTRLAATGTAYANSTSTSTSTTTGALRIAGGTGIAGNTVIGGILTVGTTTGINVSAFTDTIGWVTGSANSWTQFGLQNTNTGIGSSTDFIAYADNGDNNSGWIDMGITGQNYVNQGGAYGITGPNDGYIFMSGASGAGTGGNLVIATGNTGVYNDIVIATGGFDTIHEEARFVAHVGLRLIQGTPSVNSSTGALQVVGGVGIGGNLNVQGDISLAGNIYLTGNAIQFNTNNLTLTDSLIYLAEDNGADIVDIGTVGSFTSGIGYQHTGFVRDATDGVWKLFANVSSEPTTTVDFTNAIYSNVKVGNISAVSAGFDSNVTAAYLIGTIGTAAQPGITSVGTLTGLTSSGLINTSGNVLAASATLDSLTVNGLINTTANLSAARVNSGLTEVTGSAFLGEVFITSRAGDEGGQLNLAPAVTNNSLSGNITIDIYQNRLRIFESGGTNRGGYFDLSGLATGVGTNLAGGGGGVPGGGPNQIQFNQAASFAGAASLYYYGANGAVVSNAGIASTSTTTGSFQISGGIGVTGAVVAGQLNSTGNLLAQGATLFGLTVNGGITHTSGSISSTQLINTSGNVLASQFSGGSISVSGLINTNGNVIAQAGVFNALSINGTITGRDIIPSASNTYSIGSSTAWYSALWGKAVNAAYADLAETYVPDNDYAPGTVVIFGGEKEVTVSITSHDPSVAGVVSTNPAYHMNAAIEGLPIALQGRVPTQVKGPVRKGDRVVTSDIPGVAIRLDKTLYEPGCIIGKALEDIIDDSIQTIEVVVGRN